MSTSCVVNNITIEFREDGKVNLQLFEDITSKKVSDWANLPITASTLERIRKVVGRSDIAV